MPNLPTSLILLVLAAAWLWVLVPMFARSREAVPETDDDAAGFRVLRRARRRPSLRRSSVVEDTEDLENLDDADPDRSQFDDDAPTGDLVEDLVDDDVEDRELMAAAGIRDRRDLRRLAVEADDEPVGESIRESSNERIDERTSPGAARRRTSSDRQPVVNRVTDNRYDDDADDVGDRGLLVGEPPTAELRAPEPMVPVTADMSVVDDDHYSDASDEWDYEHSDHTAARDARDQVTDQDTDDDADLSADHSADHSADDRADESADHSAAYPPASFGTRSRTERPLDRSGVSPADPRRRSGGRPDGPGHPPTGPAPRAHRPGRGGFDPVQAEATARYRFRRRRLISLALLLLAVGLSVGSVLVDDRLWMGATVFGLALVGYLAYLSRQVKIERAIRDRRMARARRAREIRPAAVDEPAPEYRTEPRGRLVTAEPATGPIERPATYSSHVPPSRRRGYTVVDLDDDDPAFDDLERYEPVVYRHAAGQ